MTFVCEKCSYSTVDKSNYNKHLLSKKHLINIGEVKPVIKEKPTYECTHKGCSYQTQNKSNFNKHLLSHSHDPTAYYKYKCLACNEKVKDTTNLCAHLRSHGHIQNVRENFPECVKSKKINGVTVGTQPLDLSKRNVYIKDLHDENNKITSQTCVVRDKEESVPKKCKSCDDDKTVKITSKSDGKKITVKVKKDEEEIEPLNIKKFFKHEYFELDDKDVKNKVKYMWKYLKHFDTPENGLIRDEFNGLEEAIEDKKYDDAYSIIYNFFTDPSIKSLVKEYKLIVS